MRSIQEAVRVVLLIALLGACGGTGGSTTPGTVSEQDLVDEGLRQAMAALLSGSIPTVDGVDLLHQEVARIHAEEDSDTLARKTVLHTVYSLVNGEADLVRLQEIAAAAAGMVVEASPPPATAHLAQFSSDLAVYYINGVATSIGAALSNLELLAACVHQQTPDASITLLYNGSGAELTEVVCAGLGALLSDPAFPESPKTILRAAAEVACGGASLPEGITESVRQLMDLEVNRALVDFYTALIASDLLAGRRVLLVAHSQGNLYAEDILAEIAESALARELGTSLRVLALASPTQYEPFGDHVRFVQLEGDIIIPAAAILGATTGRTLNPPSANAGDCLSDELRLHLINEFGGISLVDVLLRPVELGLAVLQATSMALEIHGLATGYLKDDEGCTKAPFLEGLIDSIDMLTTPEPVVFVDTFDNEITGSEPSQWTVVYSGGISREEAAQAGVGAEIDDQVFAGAFGKSVRLFDSSGSHSVTMFKDLTPAAVADFEFNVRVQEGVDDAVNVNIRGDQMGQGVLLVLWSGDIRLRVGTVGDSSDSFIGSYQEKVWHRYRMLVDTVNDVVEVWMDGVRIDGPRPIAGPGIGDPANVDYIEVTTKVASTGTAWFDEFVVR